jgi:hypothetical protein
LRLDIIIFSHRHSSLQVAMVPFIDEWF